MADDDDLTKPLGLETPQRSRRPIIYGGLGAAALAVTAAGAGAWYWLDRAEQPGGTTVATTPIIDTGDSIDLTETGSTSSLRDGIDDDAGGLTEIVADGGLQDLNAVVIHNPSGDGDLRLAALPEIDLMEEGPYGPLPRIAPDGESPLQAYARPTRRHGGDRIAIVIGGIGVNASGTAEAIRTLPGQVTLAVAPYGDNLRDVVVDSRANGHELLLQLPLEPFNYPTNDPGPHTLTRTAGEAENDKRLRWLMSRITNYVGVVNYLGARFTADSDALTPVLDEIGDRGLLYLDDGSSSRSLAHEVAEGRAPFLRADVVLDADLTSAAIDRRLDQLQAIARERGYAIATGSAFPLTVERVAAFAEKAADRGIDLVPISALVLSGRT